MHISMTRIISISDEAYNTLKRIKAQRSFSEIILAIAREKAKKDIMAFAGVLSDKEGEELKNRMYEERKLKSRRFK